MASALNPDRILGELHQLWASLAGQAAAPEKHGVMRACALTLMVFLSEGDDQAAVGQTVAEVMRDHPNRAILVRVRPGSERVLEHRVTAQCWMPFGTREQICCEQIEIEASDATLPEVIPVLAAITAPDLPVVVWCRSRRMTDAAPFEPVLHIANVVIADSWGSDAAEGLGRITRLSAANARVADLSWARVTGWREMVAQVFEDPARRALLSGLTSAGVFYSGPPAATAYYLAAWVAASLGRDDLAARIEPVAGGASDIEGVVLNGPGLAVSVTRATATAALIEVNGIKSCASIPRPGEAELLAAELAISGRDTVFERTLPAAARMAGGGK